MSPTAVFVANRSFGLVNSRAQLMVRLRDYGWRVVAATSPGDWCGWLEAQGIEVAPVPFQRGGVSAGDALSFRRLWDLYREIRPRLVHHFNAKPMTYGGLAARGLKGTRVVSTVTGLGYGFEAGRVEGLGARMAYGMAMRRADAVIFQNMGDRELFLDRGWVCEGRARLIVSSGVELGRFSKPTGDPGINSAVLMAARLLWGKGVGEFVEAARILRRRGHEGPFVLGGEWETDHPDGVQRGFIEEAEREGTIRFTGYIQDMPEALAGSGVFVAPSYYREGVPRVVLEAAASGRAVVAADASGAREVIRDGETGLLVPPRDATELADAIETMLRSPERRRVMGEAAHREAVAHFGLDAVTEQQLEVYREIGALERDAPASPSSDHSKR